MAPHERVCFYTEAIKVGEKLAFYFAVQTGGSFDVDFDIVGPRGNLIESGTKERQRDLVFAAREIGEHSFCFSNLMSTFAEKVIDFDVTSEHETDDNHPSQLPNPLQTVSKDQAKKDLSSSENSANRIDILLNNFQRDQKFYRTRENRNLNTVKSTETRIFWFAVGESFLMILMACFQVYIIQNFFTKSTKSRI
ncbi:hypothetical protein HDU92_004911 [Lobulomyces angularis]|nr:hypothetical protein HDU92_004911 [Lobulomyces angularis]